MPWESNGGGGGRNNGGGPWGQAPGGGGPRRPGNTPNLEEILNRGRDRFQGGFPGGIPGGRWAIIGAVVVLVALWGVNSLYQIGEAEVGVELRFGKPKPELSTAGLHFMLWPIETLERVPVTLNQTDIGSAGNAAARGNAREGLMLSGDQNIVDVRFSVQWVVTEPIDYLFNVREPDEMVRATAESAMREVVGRRPAQDVFRDDRGGIETEVSEISQGILDNYGVGITISQVSIEQAAPPAEVADAFNEVQRAEQDEDRLQEEARQYANTLLGDARGQAAQIREDAAAYANRVVQEAAGEAERFNAIFAEYVNAPDITRKRLFLETMEEILGGTEKVIVEEGAGNSGVIPYLPLPELRRNTPATSAPATTTSGNGQ